MVQRLGLHAFTAEGLGFIPGQRSHAAQHPLQPLPKKKDYIHSSTLVTLTILQWSLKPNSGAPVHRAKWVHLLLTFFPAPLPSKQPNLVAEGNNTY